MGKSGIYHNPYDVRHFSRPEIQRYRASLHAQNADRLESSNQKLEREILQKILALSFNLQSEPLQAAGVMGKYLLLAILFPPYLFFYGVPNWVINEGFPVASEAVKKALHFAGGKLSAIGKHVLEFFRPAIEGASRFLSGVKNRTEQLLSLAVRSLDQTVGVPYRAVQARIGSLIEQYRSAVERARNFLIHFPVTLQAKLEEFVQKAQDTLPYLKALLLSPFNKLSRLFSSRMDGASEAFDKSSRAVDHLFARFRAFFSKRLFEPARKGVEWLASNGAIAGNWIQQKGEAFANPFARFASSVKEGASNALHRAKEGVADKLGRIMQKVSKRGGEFANSLYMASKSAAVEAGQVGFMILASIGELLPPPLVNLFVMGIKGAAAAAGKSRKLGPVLMRRLHRWKGRGEAFFRSLYKGGKALKEALIAAYEALLPYLQSFFGCLVRLLNRFMKSLVRALGGVLFIGRFALVFFHLIGRFILFMASEIFSDLTRITLKANKQ